MNVNEVLENLIVVKRSGQRVNFNSVKIAVAIKHAFDSNSDEDDSANEKKINQVYNLVLEYIVNVYENRKTINVEDIQDIIEDTLKKCGYIRVFERFNEYRLQRAASREAFSVKEQHKFVKAVEKIGLNAKNYQDSKPMDLMFNFGKTVSQEFAKAYLLESKYSRAFEEGRIYLENIDAYALKTTSSAIIDLSSIISSDISSCTEKLIDIVKHFKEEQYGEQTLMNLDLLYEKVSLDYFKKSLISNLEMFFKVMGLYEYLDISKLKEKIMIEKTFDISLHSYENILLNSMSQDIFTDVLTFTKEKTLSLLKENIYKLLEFINNSTYKLANNKVNISLSGQNNTFTNIYFKVIQELSHDNITTIYKYTSNNPFITQYLSKKLDIIIIFLDNHKNADIDSLSNMLLLEENIFSDDVTSRGKIKLSTTSINLARLGLKYHENNMDAFYNELDELLELSKNSLIQRYEYQASLYKENYSTIFNDNMLYDAKKLESNKKVRKVLRNGILNISFSGLMECSSALTNSTDIDKILSFGLKIVAFMNEKVNKYTNDLKLNFVLSEENDKQIRKHFLQLDKTMYGNIDILKKDYYEIISDYLKSSSKKYQYMKKYQDLCSFNLLMHQRSKQAIKDELDVLNKEKIKVVRFIC